MPRFDRVALISAGPLFLVTLAGCAASRSQTATATQSQDTSYGSTQYRRAAPQAAPGYGTPGYNQDQGYTQDEYPDFRGRQAPLPGPSDTEALPPPRFPVEDDSVGSDSTDRRSFRESVHQKFSGLWHRRGSNAKTNNTAERPPIAAGAAASGWNVSLTDKQFARGETANSLPQEDETSDSGLINLDAPLERKPAQTGAGRQKVAERSLPAPRPMRSPPVQPPEWSARQPTDANGMMVSSTKNLSGSPSQPAIGSTLDNSALADSTTRSLTPGAEPVRVADPPRLSVPPSGGDNDSAADAAAGLAVSRMVLCRQVRGYDDVVEIPSQQLRRGQAILVYAALDNFLSIATAKGYRTLTLSTLEILGPDGDVVLRMPLGTAVDLAEVPRQDFFLTHRVTIPENLPAGEYVFNLRIDDLQAHETSRSQLAVTVTGDRTRPDGTGDTSKFATRPDSIQR
jgi:hypothetical protein